MTTQRVLDPNAARTGLVALRRLAALHGVAVDTADAGRAVLLPAGSADDWQAMAAALAPLLGLRARIVTLPLADVGAFVGQHGPLLAWSPQRAQWFAVQSGNAQRLRLLTGDALDRNETARVADLLAELGNPSDSAAPLPWLVVDAARPNEALRRHADDGAQVGPQTRTWRMWVSEFADLRAVLVYAVAIGLLSLAVPVAVQSLVNQIAFTTAHQPLVVLTGLVLLALTFQALLHVLQYATIEYMQRRLFVRTAVDMAVRLSHAHADAFRHTSGPDLANRFFDVVTVQKAAATLLLDGVAVALQMVLGLLLLAFYHPILLAFDVVLLALLAVVLFGLGQGAIRTAIKESKAKYAVAAWLENIARHRILFGSAHGRTLAMDQVDALATQYAEARSKHFKVLLRQIGGFKVLQALASAALLGVGGYLVIDRTLSLGQLIAAELIVSSVLTGIAKFGKHLESYYDLVAAVDKLGHVTDLPLEPSGRERLVEPTGVDGQHPGITVELRGVTVGHPGKDVARDLSLTIAAGESVAILGPSGSGKSTLTDLLYAAVAPRSGQLLVDGVDLASLDRGHWRSDAVLVRYAELFDGTLADNVRMGRPEVTASDVRRTLAAVGLLDAVLALPQGLETPIVSGGSPLSRSQALRVALARAMAGRPRLLVLDEVIDALSPEDRGPVLAALLDKRSGWTLVATTHLAQVAKPFDRTLSLGHAGARGAAAANAEGEAP